MERVKHQAVRVLAWVALAAAASSTLLAQAPAAQAPVPAAYFSGLHWRLIGPFRAGRVVAVAGVPGSATQFYFGSVDGGVWRTQDAGSTWQPVFDQEPIASIGALAVAASDPKVLYAGTGESDIRSDLASGDGIYKSADGGKTWTQVGLRHSRQISRILIDPNNPDIVYAGLLGHAYGPSAERGVYKSADGGKSWQRVLDRGPETGVADMAMATSKPSLLFVTMWNAHRPPWSTYAPLEGPGSSLFRSIDSGATWQQLQGHGLPDAQWGRAGVTVSPDGRRVYAVITAAKGQSGLYRSDDGGDTWTRINKDPRLTSRGWYFNRVTIDPANPDVLYVPNVALYKSTDGGKTVSILRGAPGGDDYHELWVDPKDSRRMILGTDQGTTISLNGGKTWSTWYNQPTAQFYHVITDNRFPYAVYGAQQDSGSAAVYSRTDHGQITPRDWFLPGGSESGYIALNPDHPDIIYLTDTYGGVTRFNRKTSFSQNVSPWPEPEFGSEITTHKYRDPWTPVLVFSPDYKTLYLGTQYVLKTNDGGLSWQQISPDLTGAAAHAAKPAGETTPQNAVEQGYGVVFTIAPSPVNPQEIWAGSDTGLIHLTMDGGKTWKNVTPPGLQPWSKISMIEASRFNAGVAYAAIDRHRMDDMAPYLYRTRDYGKTWQRIVQGIPEGSFLRAVREDPKESSLLFAGTERAVYVSFNSGEQWQPLQLNLPVSSIRDLQVHANDLVIATHGRSFWILDDMTPLRQMAAVEAHHGQYLYQPETAMRIDNDGFLGTPLPPEEPTAQNPPSGAIVDYVLGSPAKIVTMTVTNAQGQVVRHFSSDDTPPPLPKLAPIAERWFPKPQRLETSAGMHRFIWDLRWASSGDKDHDADSGGDDFVPRGPRVVPGQYTVTLTIDGRKMTAPLTVVMDPRSSATQAVLQQQQELGLSIYQDSLSSRKALAEMESVQKELDRAMAPGSGHPKTAAEIAEVRTGMQAILDGASGADGLRKANVGLSSALAVVESGDREIPAQAVQIYQQSRTAAQQAEAKWQTMKQNDLPRLNEALKRNHLPPVRIAAIEQQVFFQMTR
jgi:photosystem II stability/assembly factor-like uncharacterized protein